jgi:hypothetical protein
MVAITVREPSLWRMWCSADRLARGSGFGTQTQEVAGLLGRMDELVQGLAEGFTGNETVEPFGGPVPVDHPACGVVPLDSHVGRVVQGGSQALLGDPLAHLGVLLFGHQPVQQPQFQRQ